MGLTLLLASPALAAPADLDGSFSGDGKQLVDFGAFDRATHVALAPDGRIVVVGSTNVNDPGDSRSRDWPPMARRMARSAVAARSRSERRVW